MGDVEVVSQMSLVLGKWTFRRDEVNMRDVGDLYSQN